MTDKWTELFYAKLLLSLVSIIVFVIVCELLLRLIDPELQYKNQFFPLNRDIDFPEFYKKDKELFWKLRENQTIGSRWFSDISYQINSLGLRGSEIKKEKTCIRILALGNSCTFGWGTSYEECWTRRLEERLNRSHLAKTVEVINAGVPGYSSFQGKVLIKKLATLQPDMVLIMYGWNDHWRAGKGISDAEQTLPPEIVIELQNTLSRLMLYKLMRKVTLSLTEDTTFVRMDDISGRRRVSPEEFSENLKEIIRLAKEFGAVPILVVPPIASLEIYFPETQSNFHMLHKRYQDLIIKVAEYQGVPMVNLQESFESHNDLYNDARGDPIHFNKKGHQVAAETIAEAIAPLVALLE